jgi:hypothetical protein
VPKVARVKIPTDAPIRAIRAPSRSRKYKAIKNNPGVTPEVRRPGERYFHKGHKPAPGAGAKLGSKHRTNIILKEAILIAAEIVGKNGKGQEGLIGYLEKIAREDYRVYAGLLRAVLPLQIQSRHDIHLDLTRKYDSIDDVRKDLENHGITLDAMKQIMYDSQTGNEEVLYDTAAEADDSDPRISEDGDDDDADTDAESADADSTDSAADAANTDTGNDGASVSHARNTADEH